MIVIGRAGAHESSAGSSLIFTRGVRYLFGDRFNEVTATGERTAGVTPATATIRHVSSVGSVPATRVGSTASASRQPLTVLVFSHRPEVRQALVTAVGTHPAPDLGRVRYHEAGGIAEVLAAVDAGGIDLIVLDGEAQPTGGIGLSRQLKNEITDCPPIVLAVRRADDKWLATWSQADAVLVHPLDPLTAAETVAQVLRGRTQD